MKTPSPQRGFTLIELLVVIGIIALLAAITVPAIGNMKRSDAMTAATRQLLDDVGRARQLAISQHTDVYMIFVPAGFYSDPNFLNLPVAEQRKGDRLFDKQLTGYTFVTLRSVGDQPGRGMPDYIGRWHTMPENTFIDTNKFYYNTSVPYLSIKDPGAAPANRFYPVYGFNQTNSIPFPSEEAFASGRTYVPLRYIRFNYLGQLVSNFDEFIPIVLGTVAHARDPRTKTAQPALPQMIEKPAGNRTNTFNLIQIDRLTGRARLVQPEISGT